MVIFHRNLEVYQLSLEFVEIAVEILNLLPRGQGYLGDQLKRSASSTVLNIGEGAGEFAKKEKVRFYRMALRSATESASAVDIIYRFKYIDEKIYLKADTTLDRIIAMLTKLIQRHELVENGKGKKGGREWEPLR